MGYRMSEKDKHFGVEDRGRLVLSPWARLFLKRGFDTVGDALRPTLGPTARTVLVEQMIRTDPPEIFDDAATVARRIVELPLYVNAGAMLMRHLVWRVLDQVGDGTATAAVLAQALLAEATRAIAAGANPAILRRGIESGLELALAAVDRQTSPIDGIDNVRRIALAAGHDQEIADTIAAIHDKFGMEIVISIREWLANQLSLEIADGSKWASGFASSEFITDVPRNLAWSENPYLLLTNVFLERAEQVIPIMQRVVAAGGRELVIIAGKISDSALAALLVNNRNGILHTLGVTASNDGEHRLGVLEDLAAQTSGRFIVADSGEQIENVRVSDLGRCRLFWASRDFFSMIDGEENTQAVDAQIQAIRAKLETVELAIEREQLRQRLGQLTGGVAMLGVGAATKTEMLERKSRAERAVKAVEAARRDGVVPGGGVALVNCAGVVLGGSSSLPLDERLGRQALARALEEPLRAIVENAGAEPEPVVHLVKGDSGRTGYDALRGELADVYDAGILDPINVVRTALRNGVSAAVMIMLSEALVIPRYRFLHADPKP
ncbi:MAG: chaperonin GroEL [Chloroflexota bacterium]